MSQQPPPDEPSDSHLAEIMTMVRDLGTVEIQFAGSLTAPLFWIMHDTEYGERVQNGSLFFLNTGACLFGVTAAHVVNSCLQDAGSPIFRRCLIGRHEAAPYPIDLSERVLALHEDMDIATLRFSDDEVRAIGITLLTGYQRDWPPSLARLDSWVTYAGYPGVGREWLGPNDLRFGLVVMAGKVTNASENCISVQIERDSLEPILGYEDMPTNFDFGGMSGGPVLRMVERAGLRGWVLAGVIFQGPNPSGDPTQSISDLEIIRIRPAHFINADGTLNVERWEHSKPLGHWG